MINQIILYSIRHKLVVGLLVLALIVWGVYSFTRLPIDAVPDITDNQVQIITVAGSQSALDIERLVTFPVEQTMATIPGLDHMRSFSRSGLSLVTLVFQEHVDVYWARQQVNERLVTAKESIPAGIGNPSLAPVTTGLGEIYQYVLRPKKGYENRYSAMELRTIQDWIVRRQLLGTPGVADVASFGGYLKEYEVAIDPDKLRSYNISLTEVLEALRQNNQNTGGAYIERMPQSFFIRSEGLVGSLEDLKSILVKSTSEGMPILLRDIAEVQWGHAVRYGAMAYNQEGEVVGAVTMMLKGDNSSAVVNRVKERIRQIEKNLPEGVTIEPFLDRSELVTRAINTVEKNLTEGALIVIFILVLFLGNLRAGLIVASVIPLSLLFAIGMMQTFGVSGNLMSLGAIDFGLIVDGAVIIVEATMHHLGLRKSIRKLTQAEMDQEVYQSGSQILTSAAFGEMIILIVYLPLLTLVGIEGKMFRPMAETVAFAIGGAFLLSLTYVPVASSLFLGHGKITSLKFSDKLMALFYSSYAPVLAFCLRFKKTVVAISLGFVILAGGIFFSMGGEFLPTLEEGDFAVQTRVLLGSSLNHTVEVSQKAAGVLLREFPDEVIKVVTKAGSSEIPTDPMPLEEADMMVILRDRKEWTKAQTREELAEKMGEALGVIPDANFGFQQPIQMRFNELMTGVRQDVAIKIYGENLDELSRLAEAVGKLTEQVEGAQDVFVEQISGRPQVVVKINRDALARHALNVSDVNEALNTAFAGQTAGMVFEGEKRFSLVVRLRQENRKQVDDIGNLFITNPAGEQIPLRQLADVQLVMGPNQIQREDAKRRIVVGFNVRGRDVQSIVEEIHTLIDQKIDFPAGYYVTYGGQFENLQEAQQRLAVAVPAALLLIFIMLFFAFNSIKQALLIYSAIPLAAVGGVFALLLRGMPFSISAGVGFIALFGVAVLNGIVLIGEFNRLRLKEGLTDLTDIVWKGTSTRFRPVLMTAAVASLGFLPMALAQSAGAEVQRPLATVVIGGLITSTFLTLVVLPCLYILFDKIQLRMKPSASLFAGLLMLGTTLAAQGQDLPALLERARQQNNLIKAAQLEIDVQKELKRTSSDIGKTSVMYMRGQYNSFYRNDNNLTVMQTLPFPTAMSAQRKLAEERISGSLLQKQVSENELAYQVKQAYYHLWYLKEYRALLGFQDSLYSEFARAADLRYRTGETRMLEKTTATTQALEVQNQLRQLEYDEQSWLAVLRSFLHDPGANPVFSGNLPTRQTDTTNAFGNNPQLALQQQAVAVADQEKRVLKNQALPDLTVGYFNQTLIGIPLAEAGSTASTTDRFQGFSVGLQIPLWFVPQTARIKSAEVGRERQQALLGWQQEQLRGAWQHAVQQYEKYKSSVNYYRSSALPNADIIRSQADKAYKAGEVGYLEYLLALRQSLQIREAYLKDLNQFNQSAIYLDYLAGNTQP
ncbi:MAG: CusA/CzcA family heavy metal efflux RND transporter [Cyclobacteriaceae bacterium]|nr:CusA/CzcA family heavy metal efflux RND transporter [Cyclobacteriaceae bacterium]